MFDVKSVLISYYGYGDNAIREMGKATMQRNYGLDLIKLLACIGVVTLHVTYRAYSTSNHLGLAGYLYYMGTVSIPLFFIANGYLLLGKKQISYSYVVKKIWNIIFLVLGWSVLYWILSGRFEDNIFKKTLGSLLQRGYFFQFWFLGTLIIIYAVLPFFKTYFYDKKKSYYVLVPLLMMMFGLHFSNYFLSAAPIQKIVIQTFRLWTWFSYFLLGGIVGQHENDTWFKKLMSTIWFKKITILIYFLFPFLAYYVLEKQFGIKYAEYFYDSPVTVLLTLSLFSIFIVFKPKRSLIKYIDALSSQIMGIYILHYIVLKLIEKLIPIGVSYMNLIALILVISISFSLSYLLSKFTPLSRIMKI